MQRNTLSRVSTLPTGARYGCQTGRRRGSPAPAVRYVRAGDAIGTRELRRELPAGPYVLSLQEAPAPGRHLWDHHDIHRLGRRPRSYAVGPRRGLDHLDG